jgi:hypothetical protein
VSAHSWLFSTTFYPSHILQLHIDNTASSFFSKWEKFWVKNYCPSGGGPATRISVTAVIDIYSSLNHFFPPSYIYHNVRWCHHRSLHFLFFADVFMNILIFQYCPLLFHFSLNNRQGNGGLYRRLPAEHPPATRFPRR